MSKPIELDSDDDEIAEAKAQATKQGLSVPPGHDDDTTSIRSRLSAFDLQDREVDKLQEKQRARVERANRARQIHPDLQDLAFGPTLGRYAHSIVSLRILSDTQSPFPAPLSLLLSNLALPPTITTTAPSQSTQTARIHTLRPKEKNTLPPEALLLLLLPLRPMLDRATRGATPTTFKRKIARRVKAKGCCRRMRRTIRLRIRSKMVRACIRS